MRNVSACTELKHIRKTRINAVFMRVFGLAGAEGLEAYSSTSVSFIIFLFNLNL